jgi:predicted dehydrogenase
MISLGFLGLGWIGRNRMEAMLATGEANCVAICDPNPESLASAQEIAPDARVVGSLDELLACKPDGVVIATPSALHAEQCIRAFGADAAVFCQKPLARNAREVQQVLDSAQSADRLLGVDLSYRHTASMQAIRERVRRGELGNIFASDLTFHNAYGPQSGWFWDAKLSGGGCLIDLGVHLVDLALWMLDFPEVVEARGTLLRDGHPVGTDAVENYATGELTLGNGAQVRIACSWTLNAGQDAIIDATFHGTDASVRMHNRNGSFYDFAAELMRRCDRELLVAPPDDWTGRAAAEWVRKLAAGERFSGTTTGLLASAQVLDRLYGRAS